MTGPLSRDLACFSKITIAQSVTMISVLLLQLIAAFVLALILLSRRIMACQGGICSTEIDLFIESCDRAISLLLKTFSINNNGVRLNTIKASCQLAPQYCVLFPEFQDTHPAHITQLLHSLNPALLWASGLASFSSEVRPAEEFR